MSRYRGEKPRPGYPTSLPREGKSEDLLIFSARLFPGKRHIGRSECARAAC
jgi:hypothetical protein